MKLAMMRLHVAYLSLRHLVPIYFIPATLNRVEADVWQRDGEVVKVKNLRIIARPIRSLRDYLSVLHEFGHVAHQHYRSNLTFTRVRLSRTLFNKEIVKRIVRQEAEAWAWAAKKSAFGWDPVWAGACLYSYEVNGEVTEAMFENI